MIGQLGSASISGIGLGGKFASIHNVVLSAVTAAGAILISQYLGQGSRKNAARSYSVNLLVSLAIAAVFTLVSTRFAEPILGLYTQDDATRALGQTYLQTYAWSFFPAALSGMAETLLCCCLLYTSPAAPVGAGQPPDADLPWFPGQQRRCRYQR